MAIIHCFRTRSLRDAVLLALFLPAVSARATQDSLAVTLVQYFDGRGTPFTTVQQLDSPAAIQLEGPSGRYLRLTHGTSYQVSMLAFDSVAPGRYGKITADFHCRILPTVRADGFSFVLLDTRRFDVSKPLPLFYSEEPDLPGTFGIGFDIHTNQGQYFEDFMPEPAKTFKDPDDNHISLHFDGQVAGLFSIDKSKFDIANGIFNHYHLQLQSVPGGCEVTVRIVADQAPYSVDFTPVDRFFVAGLLPYEARVLFAARVGSAATFHDLDNIEVRFFDPIP